MFRHRHEGNRALEAVLPPSDDGKQGLRSPLFFPVSFKKGKNHKRACDTSRGPCTDVGNKQCACTDPKRGNGTTVGGRLRTPPPGVPVSKEVAKESHPIIEELYILRESPGSLARVEDIVNQELYTFVGNGWLFEFLRALRPWMGMLLLRRDDEGLWDAVRSSHVYHTTPTLEDIQPLMPAIAHDVAWEQRIHGWIQLLGGTASKAYHFVLQACLSDPDPTQYVFVYREFTERRLPRGPCVGMQRPCNPAAILLHNQPVDTPWQQQDDTIRRMLQHREAPREYLLECKKKGNVVSDSDAFWIGLCLHQQDEKKKDGEEKLEFAVHADVCNWITNPDEFVMRLACTMIQGQYRAANVWNRHRHSSLGDVFFALFMDKPLKDLQERHDTLVNDVKRAVQETMHQTWEVYTAKTALLFLDSHRHRVYGKKWCNIYCETLLPQWFRREYKPGHADARKERELNARCVLAVVTTATKTMQIDLSHAVMKEFLGIVSSLKPTKPAIHDASDENPAKRPRQV